MRRGSKLAEALPLQDKMATMYALTKGEYPAPTKAMWAIMGRPVGNPRLPNRPVTAEKAKHLEAELDRLGLLATEPHGW